MSLTHFVQDKQINFHGVFVATAPKPSKLVPSLAPANSPTSPASWSFLMARRDMGVFGVKFGAWVERNATFFAGGGGGEREKMSI